MHWISATEAFLVYASRVISLCSALYHHRLYASFKSAYSHVDPLGKGSNVVNVMNTFLFQIYASAHLERCDLFPKSSLPYMALIFLIMLVINSALLSLHFHSFVPGEHFLSFGCDLFTGYINVTDYFKFVVMIALSFVVVSTKGF